MSIKLKGSVNGSVSVNVPGTLGSDHTLTLPNGVGSAGQYLRNSSTAGSLEFGALPSRFTYRTAVNTTSGTSVNFTNIPSDVKRITLFFSGVSLSTFTPEDNSLIARLGTGSTPTYKNSGYTNSSSYISVGSGANNQVNSTGFSIYTWGNAAYTASGRMVFTNAFDNLWTVDSAVLTSTFLTVSGGIVDLGATLTAVQLTTPGGTDTFDAGKVNLMYEG